MAQKLKLRGSFHNLHVQGISGLYQRSGQIVEVRIRSHDKSWTSVIKCLVVDSITSSLPSSDINVSNWNIPKNLKLADPYFNLSKEVDLLLSADILFNVLCSGKISPKHRRLAIIMNRKLGWLFSGSMDPSANCDRQLFMSYPSWMYRSN